MREKDFLLTVNKAPINAHFRSKDLFLAIVAIAGIKIYLLIY